MSLLADRAEGHGTGHEPAHDVRFCFHFLQRYRRTLPDAEEAAQRALALFLVVERRAASPVLELRLFRNPALVVGLSEVANAGDHLEVMPDERTARAIAQKRQEQAREQAQAAQRRILSLDDWAARAREGQATELALVLKTDVQGSIEPIVNSLQQLKVPDVRLNIIHSGTGNINESDINLAVASNAIVVGFRVDLDAAARRLAEMEHLQVQLYDVIYELVDDIEKAMKGLLAPTYAERVIGHAEVRQTFDIASVGRVAGCFVTDGVVRRNAKVRVFRGENVVFEGEVASLRRFDKDMREVRENFECGIRIHNFNEVQVGDRLEFYVMEREKTE